MTQTIKTNAGTNYLTEPQEKALFSHLRRIRGMQADRDYVLLKMARMLGLRRVELVRLNVGDVQGREKLLVDERIAAKGATGELYMAVELQDDLRNFLRLKKRWREDLGDDAPLFVSKKGSRISVRAINDLVKKWCVEAGIEEITPHGLRHTKGQRIMHDVRHLDEDEKVRALQFANRQLRHKSLNSTLIYTAPTKEEMEKVARI